VQTQYDHSVTVSANKTECINTTTAIFELNLTGHLANNTLYRLLNDILINANGLDVGFGVVKVCMENCTEPTIVSGPDGDGGEDDDEKMFIMLIFIVLLVAVALFLLLLIIICLMVIHKRCVFVLNIMVWYLKFCVHYDYTLQQLS